MKCALLAILVYVKLLCLNGKHTQYLDRCFYYKQWHMLPRPSLLVLHRFPCCAGPAGSDGCQSRLHIKRLQKGTLDEHEATNPPSTFLTPLR